MYQGNPNMLANTPQALMFQQQQQAAMAMNRGKYINIKTTVLIRTVNLSCISSF